MTSPAPGPYVAPSKFPWKTIAGVLLWALGVVLHSVLPQTPPALPVMAQGLGAGLGTFGAVSATADLVNAAPFLRFAPGGKDSWPHSVTMLGGGLWLTLVKLVTPLLPQTPGVLMWSGIALAASFVVVVVGWRLWLRQIVARTLPVPKP